MRSIASVAVRGDVLIGGRKVRATSSHSFQRSTIGISDTLFALRSPHDERPSRFT